MNIKNRLLIIIILIINNVNGQEVLMQKEINIPAYGNKGDAHLIDWSLSEDFSKIYIYTYNHIAGNFLITSKEEIDEKKKKYEGKKFFGKLLQSLIEQNTTEEINMPIVQERVISSKSLDSLETNTRKFHPFNKNDIPENNRVYFKPGENIINLNFPFSWRNSVKYNINEINKVFKESPKIKTDIISYIDIEARGEGLLKLKNLDYKILEKKAVFDYVPRKGFMTTVTDTVLNLINTHNDYEYISESHRTIKNGILFWYKNKNKDNYRDYKLAFYDKKKNTIKDTLIHFDYNNQINSINIDVYDNNFDLKGYLSVFKVTKKGDKKYRKKELNSFDFIFYSKDGNIIDTLKVKLNGVKNINRILNPFIVMYKDDKFNFFNVNKASFNDLYEVISVNEDGELVYEHVEKMHKDVFSDYTSVKKVNSDYLFMNFSTETKTVATNINGNIYNKKEKIYPNVSFTLLDEAGKQKVNKEILIKGDEMSPISMQIIKEKSSECIYLLHRENNYMLVKINNGDILSYPIDLKFSKEPTAKLYFGKHTNDVALINKNDRLLYLMTQFYTFLNTGQKKLTSIGITGIKY